MVIMDYYGILVQKGCVTTATTAFDKIMQVILIQRNICLFSIKCQFYQKNTARTTDIIYTYMAIGMDFF